MPAVSSGMRIAPSTVTAPPMQKPVSPHRTPVAVRYSGAPPAPPRTGRFEKVDLAPLAIGRPAVVIGHARAGIEIGGERLVARRGEAVADALDLDPYSPPFLDHDDARRIGGRGLAEIAGGILAVRPPERDLRPHMVSAPR